MKTKSPRPGKGIDRPPRSPADRRTLESLSLPVEQSAQKPNTTLSDEQLLQQALELDAAYARADAFDAAQPSGPTRTVFRVYWDNGAEACGTFDDDYPTHEAAQQAADDWAAESNARDGIDPDRESGYTAEAIEVEVPDPDAEVEDPGAQMEELRKAALNRGRP